MKAGLNKSSALKRYSGNASRDDILGRTHLSDASSRSASNGRQQEQRQSKATRDSSEDTSLQRPVSHPSLSAKAPSQCDTFPLPNHARSSEAGAAGTPHQTTRGSAEYLSTDPQRPAPAIAQAAITVRDDASAVSSSVHHGFTTATPNLSSNGFPMSNTTPDISMVLYEQQMNASAVALAARAQSGGLAHAAHETASHPPDRSAWAAMPWQQPSVAGEPFIQTGMLTQHQLSSLPRMSSQDIAAQQEAGLEHQRAARNKILACQRALNEHVLQRRQEHQQQQAQQYPEQMEWMHQENQLLQRRQAEQQRAQLACFQQMYQEQHVLRQLQRCQMQPSSQYPPMPQAWMPANSRHYAPSPADVLGGRLTTDSRSECERSLGPPPPEAAPRGHLSRQPAGLPTPGHQKFSPEAALSPRGAQIAHDAVRGMQQCPGAEDPASAWNNATQGHPLPFQGNPSHEQLSAFFEAQETLLREKEYVRHLPISKQIEYMTYRQHLHSATNLPSSLEGLDGASLSRPEREPCTPTTVATASSSALPPYWCPPPPAAGGAAPPLGASALPPGSSFGLQPRCAELLGCLQSR